MGVAGAATIALVEEPGVLLVPAWFVTTHVSWTEPLPVGVNVAIGEVAPAVRVPPWMVQAYLEFG